MESLRRAVRQCSVMVVVIGPLWLLSADGDEKSDRTDDIVRIEVSIALESGIGIFPILIAPASFPRAEDLPPDLRKLVDYRGHALRIDSWEGDYAALRERLRTIVEKPQEGPIAERPLLIYLSSTVSDLQNHRAAVTQALTGLGHRVVHNESYEMGGRFRRRPRASDSSTFDLPFRYIAECDVFICMVAWRYEADPEPESNPAGTSVVEREYRKARELGKPILPFLLREDVPWPEAHVDGIIEGRDARVHAFRELLWREHTVGIFSSVEDLVAKAATSLSRFKEARALPARDSSPAAEAPQRVLVFVGHTIDVPARVEPRFPESVISAAYNAIADVVKQELATGNVTLGIASGSHGGDLLFHQVCADLGIRTQLFLPLAPDEFSQRYVAPAGTEWVERFRRARHSETKVGSFRTSGDTRVGFHDVWQQNSDAMLDGARAPGGEVVLIALWDREAAGGPTYLVQRANMLGIRTIVIDSKQLLQSRLPTRPRLKIYMSIAWDVVEERHIAQAVLETLSHATWLKDRATLEIATWDPSLPFVDEEAPMLNYEDHPPGEADLFVVILWGRLGVPIHVSESHPPLSAVQYELGEAISHGREVFVYQRTGKPRANVDDPDLDERVRQYESVLDFVKEQRQAGRFVSTYDSPADFRSKFEHQLSAYLRAKLQVDA